MLEPCLLQSCFHAAGTRASDDRLGRAQDRLDYIMDASLLNFWGSLSLSLSLYTCIYIYIYICSFACAHVAAIFCHISCENVDMKYVHLAYDVRLYDIMLYILF